jgi:hypothetical protein
VIFQKMNKIKAILLAAFCIVSSIATAVPITFNNFNGTFPYAENGFTVAPTQTPAGGAWQVGQGGIETTAPQNFVGLTVLPGGFQVPDFQTSPGTIEINSGASGLFFFNGVDLRGGTAESCYYDIVGLLNGTTVFTDSGGLNTGYDYSSNQYNPISGNPLLLINSLFITLYSDPSVTTSYSISNIDVTSIPDSSPTFALLGISASALIIFGVRNQRLATKS